MKSRAQPRVSEIATAFLSMPLLPPDPERSRHPVPVPNANPPEHALSRRSLFSTAAVSLHPRRRLSPARPRPPHLASRHLPVAAAPPPSRLLHANAAAHPRSRRWRRCGGRRRELRQIPGERRPPRELRQIPGGHIRPSPRRPPRELLPELRRRHPDELPSATTRPTCGGGDTCCVGVRWWHAYACGGGGARPPRSSTCG